jgi:phospholipid/cholesterol/gamma-HCH transport system permease protein
VIVGFFTLATGGTLAFQRYSARGNIGIEALTGFLAAFINVRIAAPDVAGSDGKLPNSVWLNRPRSGPPR